MGQVLPLSMPAGALGRDNHQKLINTLIIIIVSFDTFHQTISWMVYGISSDCGVLQNFYNYPCKMLFCKMRLLYVTRLNIPLPLPQLLNAGKSERLKIMVKWKNGQVTHTCGFWLGDVKATHLL